MTRQLRQQLRRMIPLVIALCGLFMSQEAFASHFRHGTISWTIPDPMNAPRTVQFTTTTSWRTGALGNPTLNYGGPGTLDNAGTVMNIGTGVDTSGQSYTTRERISVYTYSGTGTGPFTVFFDSCCRISGLQGGASSQDYRVETIVDLSAGNTGGPVTGGTAIIQMQIGAPRTYFFAASDPDGDPLNCRFATAAETGYNFVVPTVGGNAAALNTQATGCNLNWDLSGAVAGDVGDKHVLHVVVESTHNGVVSKTALDLIVELVATESPTCTGGGVFTRFVGQPLSEMVTGTQGGMVAGALEATVIGNGMITTPTTGASPLTNTLNWTPTMAEQNSTVNILVLYRNVVTNQTGTCSFTVNVPDQCMAGNVCSVPGGVGICADGVTACPGGPNQPPTCVANTPQMETCDGLDNDCNGTPDDGAAIGQACMVAGQNGVCAVGASTCTGGMAGCMQTVNPGDQMEVCDGQDNDCDGNTDEAADTVGNPCMTGLDGVCAAGTSTCAMGMAGCMPTITPGSQMETCDGQDNDCDGNVDNGFNVGMACTVGMGACEATGTFQCDMMGGSTCDATAGMPSTELCGDNIDSDCDGDPNNGCPCVTDADCGGANSGSICIVTGGMAACGSGCKGMDAEMDAGCPMTQVCTSTDTTPGLCVQCLTDTDCGAADSGMICEMNACTMGCRGMMGNGCPMPQKCTSSDATAGTCVECQTDSDCGAMDSGKVCNAANSTCQDGCRGMGGNGCAAGEMCSSTDNTIGTCSGKDTDGDGLTDDEEAVIGTDPNDADSDDDGLPDGEEIDPGGDTDMDGKKNALDDDADGDGLKDGTEAGKDCSNPGTDTTKGNCVADGDAGATKTDPNKADTDEGGVDDGTEDTNKNGVVDAGERDPNNKADDNACSVDSECGGPTSGKICEGNMCVDGCRGMGGNGCPDTEICSSTDNTPGKCEMGGMGGMGGGSGAGGTAGSAGTAGTAGTAGSSGGCQTNADCAAGQTCNTTTNTCEATGVSGVPEDDIVAQGSGLCSVQPGNDGRGMGAIVALFAAAAAGSLLRRRQREAALAFR